MINKKQWKSLEKEGKMKGINNSYDKEVFPLRQLQYQYFTFCFSFFKFKLNRTMD